MDADLPWARLEAEASRIVTEAGEAGVTLRVTGSAGIRLHCEAAGRLMDALGRPAKDIDLVVPERQRKGMRRYLESRGYVADRDLLVAMEGTRYSFRHPRHGTEIDVFVERLEFCHTIDVGKRLGLHPVTLSVEDLMLAKLQIVEMTTTDVMDVAVLLKAHQVAGGRAGGADPEVINSGYVAGLLAADWGFHHTATRNLRRIAGIAEGTPDGREGVNGPGVSDRGAPGGEISFDGVPEAAASLLAAIDAAPKSLAWRLRDKIGERRQWWQDVNDKEATY
jgi:hypothetical protein